MPHQPPPLTELRDSPSSAEHRRQTIGTEAGRRCLLRQRYEVEGLTSKEIGRLLGMSPTSVNSALHRAGIELRGPVAHLRAARAHKEASPPPPVPDLGEPRFTVMWVSAAFDAGTTVVEIASATGTSPPAVAKLLQVAATG